MYVSVSWAKKWCLSELEAIQCRTGKIDFPELRAFLFKWWNQTGYTINVYVYRISLECVTENRHKAKGLEFGHFVEKYFGEEQPTTFLLCWKSAALEMFASIYTLNIVCWTYRWNLRHYHYPTQSRIQRQKETLIRAFIVNHHESAVSIYIRLNICLFHRNAARSLNQPLVIVSYCIILRNNIHP